MSAEDATKQIVRVALLEDHHTTVDGYTYRLSLYPNIRLVATARNGEQLLQLLEQHEVDVLILDVVAPAAEGSSAPYPLFNVLPKLRKQYPHMSVLVISGHRHPTLIRAVMEAGARGYIVKTDLAASERLGEIITSLATGGMYLSEQTVESLANKPGGRDDIDMLTDRQREVLSMCAANPGMPTDELAAKLNIAPSTVRNLLSSSYKRLRVNNMTAAIMKARELGLITPLDDIYEL